MEPRIQYAKTEDGVNIACYAIGRGPAILRMPNIPWSHFQLQWRMVPEQRAMAEATARTFTFVEYDSRGTGSSTREVTDFTLEAHVKDLEAVVAQLGLANFTLMGQINSGPVAISYALRNPQQLSHLILLNSYARNRDVSATPESKSFQALIEQDWTIYSETIAQFMTGWAGEAGRYLAGFFRESVSQEVAVASYKEFEKVDVSSMLSQIQTPTLVIHQGTIWPPVESSRSLAANIPDARLVITDDLQEGVIAVGEFLGVDAATVEEGARGPERERSPATLEAPTVQTILFTDMESSTALTQSLGDAKAQELVRAHNEIVRGALTTHGGSEVKHTGDGIMASFASASSALGCAVAIQRAVAARAAEQPEFPLGLRVGLNAGEPVVEERDIFGASVQLARRICDHAEPGQILASNVVRELAMGKGFLFGDVGETELRGFEDPVKLWEVRWREQV